jgi:hypothetical protein
MTEEEYD